MAIFLYKQSTGGLYFNGTIHDFGYSGFSSYKNDPAQQHMKGLGPIPRGTYICGKPEDHQVLGPISIPLQPGKYTETHGRGDFFIHGDSKSFPGHASHGCIILSKETREFFKEGDILIVWED